jgi:hypothetical protein
MTRVQSVQYFCDYISEENMNILDVHYGENKMHAKEKVVKNPNTLGNNKAFYASEIRLLRRRICCSNRISPAFVGKESFSDKSIY